MTPYHEKGLLGSEAAQWSTEHCAANAELFETMRALNSAAHQFLLGLSVNPTDERQLVAASLFARSLELFAATLFLIERGLESPARAMVRVLLETTFALRAICDDDALLRRYIDQDQLQRRKLINKARMTVSDALREVREHATDERLAEITGTIESEGICGLTTEDLARKAGLHEWYLTAYASLSSAVHSTIRDIEKHFTVGSSGLPERMELGPTSEQTVSIGGTAGQLLTYGLPALAVAFDVPMPEGVKPLHAKLTAFVAPWSGDQ